LPYSGLPVSLSFQIKNSFPLRTTANISQFPNKKFKKQLKKIFETNHYFYPTKNKINVLPAKKNTKEFY